MYSIRLNGNFQRGVCVCVGGGGGGLCLRKKNSLPWGRYGYVLELHIQAKLTCNNVECNHKRTGQGGKGGCSPPSYRNF